MTSLPPSWSSHCSVAWPYPRVHQVQPLCSRNVAFWSGVDVPAQRSLATTDLGPNPRTKIILVPIMPLNRVPSVRIAKPIHVDPIVEISALVVARSEEVLLTRHPSLIIPGFPAVPVVPVVDVAEVVTAGEVGPFQCPGTAVVDAAAAWDATAGRSSFGCFSDEQSNYGCGGGGGGDYPGRELHGGSGFCWTVLLSRVNVWFPFGDYA